MSSVRMRVNGQAVDVDVEPRTHLADLLRERLRLTATHLGCEHGVCGACTVLIDGVPARSCITFPAALQDAEITTIEGLEADPTLDRLRDAFSAEHGLQCGFCTPGMLVTARDIALRLPDADPARIRRELSGNLCRCTGYAGIVRAIARVARETGAPPETVSAHETGVRPLAVSLDAPRADRDGEGRVVDFRIMDDADGSTRIIQVLELDFPRDRVWAFFQDTGRLVACMPGATLTDLAADGSFTGDMRVRVGPIAARFSGKGTVDADPAGFTGAIRGQGSDTGSSTRVSGSVDYAMTASEPSRTCVEIAVSYRLTGSLAQIARGGLARDLASRLAGAFAENIGRSLSGKAPEGGAAPPNALALVFAVLKSRLARVFSPRPR